MKCTSNCEFIQMPAGITKKFSVLIQNPSESTFPQVFIMNFLKNFTCIAEFGDFLKNPSFHPIQSLSRYGHKKSVLKSIFSKLLLFIQPKPNLKYNANLFEFNLCRVTLVFFHILNLEQHKVLF